MPGVFTGELGHYRCVMRAFVSIIDIRPHLSAGLILRNGGGIYEIAQQVPYLRG